MAEERVDPIFAAVLGQILETNGYMSVGLAAGHESSVPASMKIQVYKNIGAANTPAKRLIAAKVMFERSKNMNPDNPLNAYSQYCIMSFGLLGVKNRGGDDVELPINMSEQQFHSYDWDGDVTYVDEEIDFTVDPRATKLSDEDQVIVKLVALAILASKITWFSALHHLGASIGRGRQAGYLAKVVRALALMNPLFEVDWLDPISVTKIYNCVHPASTLLSMKIIFANCPFVADLRRVTSIPVDVPAAPMRVDTDILIRQTGLQAGFASLSDTVAALKSMSSLPFMSACPGIAAIPALSAAYVAARAHPFKFGLSAIYLTGSSNGTTDRFEKEPFKVLIAAAAAYVKAILPNSTLSRAAIFSGNPEEMDGFDRQWSELLNGYAIHRMRSFGNVNDFLEAVVGVGGGGHYYAMSDGLQRAFEAMDINITANAWNQQVGVVARQVGANVELIPGEQGHQGGGGFFDFLRRQQQGGGRPV